MGLMSKILHKDKDGKDSKHHDEDDETTSTTTGAAGASGGNVQNKSYYTGPTPQTTSGADNITSSSQGLGTNNPSTSHGQFADTAAGPHSSNTGNKIDPRVDSDNSRFDPATSSGRTGYGSDNYGPHSSSTGNKVDPRVDSDTGRYDSAGRQGLGGDSYGRRNDYDTTSGPHSSNTANRVDPRVDSDNSRYAAAGGPGASHGQFADTANSGRPGYDSTPGAFPGSSSGKPHVERDGYGRTQDPVVPDYTGSDRYGSNSGPGYSSGPSANFSGRDPYPNTSSTHPRDAPGPYGTREDYGSTGPASNTLGPHSSNAANVVDPRVRPEPEKMRDHKTVGPHQSDMLNKMDPRVDSDPRDHGYASRDPYDDRNRYDTSDRRHSPPTQTGGFVGGPHERLENRGSVPTAGGLPVGADGNGPYDDMRGGSRGTDPYSSRGGMAGGSHGREPYETSSRGGMMGGSHGRDPYESSPRGGGMTGSHGRDPYDARGNEPYGANNRFGSGPRSGSGPDSLSHGMSDLEIKERELALRHKELDLKEREQNLRRM